MSNIYSIDVFNTEKHQIRLFCKFIVASSSHEYIISKLLNVVPTAERITIIRRIPNKAPKILVKFLFVLTIV